jgi:hypothetical protein
MKCLMDRKVLYYKLKYDVHVKSGISGWLNFKTVIDDTGKNTLWVNLKAETLMMFSVRGLVLNPRMMFNDFGKYLEKNVLMTC